MGFLTEIINTMTANISDIKRKIEKIEETMKELGKIVEIEKKEESTNDD